MHVAFAPHARRLGVAAGVAVSLLSLVYVCVLSVGLLTLPSPVLLGEKPAVEDALRQLARASDVEPSVSVAVNWTKYRTVAAGAYLVAGRLDQAGHEAESGYSLAIAHGARAYLPTLLRLRAEIALAGDGKAEEVSQRVDTGLAIAEELGLRAAEARLRLVHAMVMKRRGEPARARTELERARRLLTAMDMLRWLGSWEGN